MAQQGAPVSTGGYVTIPGPQQPMMTQQYIVTIQNTGAVGPSPMKVKAIKVSAQIQLCCGIVSAVLGVVAIKLLCIGYQTGTPIWGGLAFYVVAGVLGLYGAHKKNRCIIIAYMVLSIISSVIAVQQVFTSATWAAVGGQSESCPPMNAVSSAVGLLEIVSSIVAAAYCCRVVCCGQQSTTMVQYVPAVPMGVPQPGMLQSQSVYSPVTCPAMPGEATLLSMPAHPPPYQAPPGASAAPQAQQAGAAPQAQQAGELPTKQNMSGPYHSTTGVDGENPGASETLLS